eukprot:COSAG02_NODE_9961_length_2064_cov_1.186768_3_plen_111_part_00
MLYIVTDAGRIAFVCGAGSIYREARRPVRHRDELWDYLGHHFTRTRYVVQPSSPAPCFKWHYVKPVVDAKCVASTAVERFHTQTVELKGSGEWEIIDSGEVVAAVEDADA